MRSPQRQDETPHDAAMRSDDNIVKVVVRVLLHFSRVVVLVTLDVSARSHTCCDLATDTLADRFSKRL